jgi:uncharacterized membrane protein YkoI
MAKEAKGESTMKTHSRLALLAGAAALMSTGAFAADRDDIQALGQAKLSLTQAIEMAAKEGNGVAIDAEFEQDDGRGNYEVKVLGQDTLVTYTLDADSGAVLDTENERLEKYFTRLEPQDLRNAHTTLAQAIGVAEQRVGGKAIDAEVSREGDHVEYEVTVAQPGGMSQEIRINGASGQVAER